MSDEPLVPKRYFLRDAGKESGPYSLAHLQGLWRRGEIAQDAQYLLEGDQSWKPILEIKQKLDPTPREETLENVPSKRERSRHSRKRRAWKRNLVAGFFVILFLVGIALLAMKIGQFF